jgi:hypothetical protein
VYCFCILSNKLDLKQETLLYYTTEYDLITKYGTKMKKFAGENALAYFKTVTTKKKRLIVFIPREAKMAPL